jgi:hypothetical protein
MNPPGVVNDRAKKSDVRKKTGGWVSRISNGLIRKRIRKKHADKNRTS